jgi:hypothetical protein
VISKHIVTDPRTARPPAMQVPVGASTTVGKRAVQVSSAAKTAKIPARKTTSFTTPLGQSNFSLRTAGGGDGRQVLSKYIVDEARPPAVQVPAGLPGGGSGSDHRQKMQDGALGGGSLRSNGSTGAHLPSRAHPGAHMALPPSQLLRESAVNGRSTLKRAEKPIPVDQFLDFGNRAASVAAQHSTGNDRLAFFSRRSNLRPMAKIPF